MLERSKYVARLLSAHWPFGQAKALLEARARSRRQKRILKIAARAFRVGHLATSESAARHVLDRDPQNSTALNFWGVGTDTAASRIADAVEHFGLADIIDRPVATYSGGQRRRLEIARALLSAPEVLFLDEPTVGLDPVLRADLWEQFTDLARAGTTLLVSSHVMDEAEHCGDLLLIREGSLVAHTTPTQLREDTGCTSLEDAFLSIIKRNTMRQAG